jgi:hypothetical protein
MSHAPSVTVGSNKYGQWEYSNQSGDWETFPHFFPSVATVTHDSPMPFGKLAALGATGCPSNSSFTPGVTNTLYHGGENSYGLEPGFLLVDQGTPSAESILLTGACRKPKADRVVKRNTRISRSKRLSLGSSAGAVP